MGDNSDVVSSPVKDRAMDGAPVGIVLSDPHQDDNPLIYVNETFTQLTGYDRAEILGRNCRFLQGPATAAEPVERMREAITNEQPVTVEIRNYRKDGTSFWNEVTIAPIHDEDGSVRHFVGFQSDVTDRKTAEQEWHRRTTELEQLVERVDGLLHDITEELMHAESREETELAICDRIVCEPRYHCAWVGEFDPVTETVELTNHRGLLSDWSTTPIDGAGGSVLRETLETGQVEVVSDRPLLDGLLISTDCEAAAVIPLRYQAQRYGALVVGVATEETLSSPEPSVLGSIGNTIATAIHAAQTRRQLAEDTRVVATFTIADRSFPLVELAATAGMVLDFEGAVEQRDGTTSLFFTTDGEFETLQSAAETIDSLSVESELNDVGDRRMVELIESSQSIVSRLAQRRASVTELVVSEEEARLELELLPAVDGRALVEAFQSWYPDAKLTEYRTRERPPETRDEFVEQLKNRLTAQQQLVLKRAFLAGFYDPDRGATGSELADSMGISRSTFHQHRRAAERKLIEMTLD